MTRQEKFEAEMSSVKDRLIDIISKHNYGVLRFTLVPREDQIRLLDTYPDEIKAWRDFMTTVYAADESDWDEVDFHDLCRGFMAGRGVNTEDAHSIATFCRYNLQDFDMKEY